MASPSQHSKLDDIFATGRGTRKINKRFGNSYADEYGKTSFYYTNSRMLLEGEMNVWRVGGDSLRFSASRTLP